MICTMLVTSTVPNDDTDHTCNGDYMSRAYIRRTPTTAYQLSRYAQHSRPVPEVQDGTLELSEDPDLPIRPVLAKVDVLAQVA